MKKQGKMLVGETKMSEILNSYPHTACTQGDGKISAGSSQPAVGITTSPAPNARSMLGRTHIAAVERDSEGQQSWRRLVSGFCFNPYLSSLTTGAEPQHRFRYPLQKQHTHCKVLSSDSTSNHFLISSMKLTALKHTIHSDKIDPGVPSWWQTGMH